jgi:hypothetical protein
MYLKLARPKSKFLQHDCYLNILKLFLWISSHYFTNVNGTKYYLGIFRITEYIGAIDCRSINV